MVNRLEVGLSLAETSSGKKDHLYTSQDKVIEKAAKEVLAAMQTDNVSGAREIFDKYAQSVTSQAFMSRPVLTINELIKPLLNLTGIKASQVFNEFTPKLCKILEIKGSESIINEDLRAKYLIQQYLDEENYNSLLDYISQNRDRIEDQSILIEAAKKMAQGSKRAIFILSQKIADFRITDEQALIEIAKIAAAQDGERVSEHIQNYGIKDQRALIEIAKIAVVQGIGIASLYIQNYGIANEQALIKIAKAAASQGNLGVSVFIQHYGIKNQQALIEIAKIDAAQSNVFSNYIQNYGITDQKAFVEIAKIAAAQDGLAISEHIQKYKITDQQILIEIAKIVAAKDAWAVSKYIQHFGIKDQQALIEIAKIAAAQSGVRTSKLIKNYGITNQQALIEIAKIAAAQSGLGVSLHIQSYEITSEQALVEIAKIAAVQHAEAVSRFIQNYGIKDQQALIEIAKIAAVQNGDKIFPDLKNYGITDQQAAAKIKQIAVAQRESQTEPLLDACLEVAAAKLKVFSFEQQQKLEEIQRNSVKSVSTQVFKEKLKLFLILVTRLKLQGKTPEQLEAVLKMLERIMYTRSHLLSLELSHHLIALTHDVKRIDIWKNASLDKNRACFLPMLLLSALKGESPEVYKNWAQKLSADRDGPRGKARLNAILSLVKNSELSQREKKELVNWVIKEDSTQKKRDENKKLLRDFQLIEQLLELHQEEEIRQALKDFSGHQKEDFFKHLTKIRNKAMSRLLGVEMTDTALEKLEASFGKFRQPTALFKYAVRLAGLRHVKTIECLGGYVQSVMEGNFKKVRYSLEKNPHLATATQGYPGIFEKWQSGSEIMLEPSSSKKQSDKYILEDTDDPCDLLLIGTEVMGSCQSVDASADTNRGLLSYLLDGKNRAIVIKDSQGVIQARCVIRLLWDPVSSRPVLFQERIYPDSSSLPRDWVKALEKGCLQKAQDLGLDLLSLNGKEPYQGKVVSLGGPVPFEYVDAVGGLKKEGKFEIKNAKRVELLEEKTEEVEA